jgi:acyl-CoA thioesterase-2
MVVVQDALDAVVQLLDLETIDVNLFRGISPPDAGLRVFGGQVAGQALVAAARTVDADRLVHSLHAYFVRPGDPSSPILYDVERVRDGRSFTTRRVRGVQKGVPIFHLSASFQVPEPGFDHQFPMPDVPRPDELPDWREQLAPYRERFGGLFDKPRPIEIRYASGVPTERTPSETTGLHLWMRANGRLPDDPVLHTCMLTYMSDLMLLDTALLPHGRSGLHGDVQLASLDHAMWFHRPFRADEWLLFHNDTPSAFGARGHTRSTIWTIHGALVVSVVQEGLIRPVRAEGATNHTPPTPDARP